VKIDEGLGWCLQREKIDWQEACGLSSPTFIGDCGRIELSYSINFFVRSDHHSKGNGKEGEVSLKELKDTVLLLAKQMVELKAAMSQRENCFKKLRRSIGEDQVWS